MEGEWVAGDEDRRVRFPLYLKILSCLALNVALVGAVSLWLLGAHFGVDRDWLLSDAARGRLQAMSQVLLAELREEATDQWDAIVERTGEAQRVRLALFDATGQRVAGSALELHPDARERLQRPVVVRPPPGRRLFLIRRDREGPENPIPSPRHLSAEEVEMHLEAGHEFPKEAFRTRDPDGYWFLVRLPHPQRPPMALVGMTERLGATGLLFDPKPWLWAAAGVFGFSVLLWLPLARGVTRSISEMTRATEAVARGRFDARVDEARGDELGRLGGAINRMSVRLEGFVAGQKRFLGDAAHELCSPLARMEIGLGLLKRGLGVAELRRLEEVSEELQEMRMLASELLAFSKAGMESERAALEPVALESLARAVIEREVPGLPVEMEVQSHLKVLAAPSLLQRALANVLRNAAQHAGASPKIEIVALADGDWIILRVSDRGPGVAPEALPKLFDPFYRVDSSRNRETGGVGLGLAIVKNCIESCGGEAAARNREGGGLTLELRLRRAAPESRWPGR